MVASSTQFVYFLFFKIQIYDDNDDDDDHILAFPQCEYVRVFLWCR